MSSVPISGLKVCSRVAVLGTLPRDAAGGRAVFFRACHLPQLPAGRSRAGEPLMGYDSPLLQHRCEGITVSCRTRWVVAGWRPHTMVFLYLKAPRPVSLKWGVHQASLTLPECSLQRDNLETTPLSMIQDAGGIKITMKLSRLHP